MAGTFLRTVIEETDDALVGMVVAVGAAVE
jgi:hypothetical protein